MKQINPHRIKTPLGVIALFFVFCFSLYAQNQPAANQDQTQTQTEGENQSQVQNVDETTPQPTDVPTEPAAVETPAASPAALTTTSTGEIGNVSIDFKDADISNVLRILSLKSGINIVAGPEVQGTVTIRLENVPWENALNVVLRTYGYVYERQANIIRVTTKDNLATEELVTETFALNYTTAAEAEIAIKDILSERGRIKSVGRTNMLIISDVPTNLHKVRQVVERLDKSTPQAHIDSKIIKTQLQEGENLGIAWTPAGTLSGSQRPTTFPYNAFNRSENSDPFERLFGNYFANVSPVAGAAPTANASNVFDPRAFPQSTSTSSGNTYTYGTLNFTGFSAVLNFLRTRSNTRVISNPRITVLNNQKAKIQVGTDVALPAFERNETTGSFEISGFSYRPTGVVMEVIPHINESNEILVDLKPEVSAQSGNTTFATSGSLTQIPNFSVTNAITQVLIKSGETIAIGGLMTDSYVTTEQKVPILGDIPGMGKIFRSKRRTEGDNNSKVETLFFITVTIVDTEGEPVVIHVPQAAVVNNLPASNPQPASAPAASTVGTTVSTT